MNTYNELSDWWKLTTQIRVNYVTEKRVGKLVNNVINIVE